MKRALNVCVAAAGLVLLVSSQSQAQDPVTAQAQIPVQAPAPAEGRSWTGRGFIALNFAGQMRASETVPSTTSLALYGETGDVATTQDVNGQGSFFGPAAGVRVVGNFGVGFAYSRVSKSGTWSGTARVPHPVFYDSPRTASLDAKNLDRVENAYHFQIVWVLPLGKKLDVMASVGPTYFSLQQDAVGQPVVTEVGSPYTTVQVSVPAAVTSKTNKWGFNIGADVTYRIHKMFGAGGFVRWSRATASVDSGVSPAFDTKIGGLQIGGGLRVRF